MGSACSTCFPSTQSPNTASHSQTHSKSTNAASPHTAQPPAENQPFRNHLLAAAESRQQAASLKGVQPGGGKLAKKLQESKRSPTAQEPSGGLQWTVDA